MVGVLIEVPVMLMPVKICRKTGHWFTRDDSRQTAAVSAENSNEVSRSLHDRQYP